MRVITLFCVLLSCFFSPLTAQTLQRIEGSPYPYSTPPDTLYLTSENYTYSQRIALQSLQGVLAKTKPEILRDIHGVKDLVIKQGIKIKDTYYSDFQGLLTHFSSRLAGYILCDAKQSSTNVAISLSGIFNAVAIPADIEQTAINAGLTMLQDVRGKNETWVNAKYGSQFSKKIASYQNVSDDRGLYLGDYSAFAGAIQFWTAYPTGTLANSIFNRLTTNGAIMGWGPNEDKTVESLSAKSLVMHAADWAPNLSTLTNIPVGKIEQKEPAVPYKVVPNVHTVCFVMSDGDNIQWLLGVSDNTDLWANPNRSKVNLGWTISPALLELAPPLYKKYVDNTLTSPDGRNYLIAAPSGRGYFNPGLFPDLSNECDLLNLYMKKADLRIANVIDVDNSPWKLEPYLRQDNIDALFYYNYSDYSTLKGQISWYKDKPSIAGRYDLWLGTLGQPTDKTPATLAESLNAASTDIHSPDSYSLIPVIVWSRQVKDVLECIGKLNPNVRVVAPDEFVWLIRKNLKGLALGIGNGLKGDYYAGRDFDVLKYSQTDRTVELDSVEGLQHQSALGTESFSVRWSGQIQPVYSEEYTFYVTVNGGAKLTINGNVVIDKLSTTGVSTQSGTITLVAGQKYEFGLEYSKDAGNASCHLEWESNSQMRQTVPKLQLYSEGSRVASTGLVTAYADCDYAGFSTGLKVGNYTLAEMNTFGILDKDIASLKITKGFKVILYENDNFGGASLEVTADTICLGDWKDRASSLKITTTGVTNLDGTYFLQNAASNLYMTVNGGYSNVADGANIMQFSKISNTSQQFKFTHLGDGIYKIFAVHSDKSMDVDNGSKSNGANVQQWTYYGFPSQQFIVSPADSGSYLLIALHSGKIIESITTSTNANVRQYANTNQKKGQWKLVPVPALPSGTGIGLDAQYYNGMNFETLRYTTIDSTIHFNWGSNAPNTAVAADNFSVRWSGEIQPQASGAYTFYVNSDNGRRLWVNDQLIIDKWIDDYGTEYSGSISLTANRKYTIKLEYFESQGGAGCTLQWMSAFQSKEVVPKSQLYPASLSAIDENSTEASDVTIFPNPVINKTMNVQLEGLSDNTEHTLILFDLLGKPVYSTKIVHSCSVDLNNLPSGVYIVSIRNKENFITKRIVVH